MDKKFIKFYDLCEQQPHIFSLEQAAMEVGTDMKKINKWSTTKEVSKEDSEDAEDPKDIAKFRKSMIRKCGYNCAKNVARAFTKGELTQKEAERHLKHLKLIPSSLDYFQQQAKKMDAFLERRQDFNKMSSEEYLDKHFKNPST